MRITQLRVFSALLMFITAVLLMLSFATNYWYSITLTSLYTGNSTTYNYGLLKYCFQGECLAFRTSQSWRMAVISCIAIAIIVSLITLIGFLVVFIKNSSTKVMVVGNFMVALLAAAALLIYPFKMNVSGKGSMDYSYYIGWIGQVTATGAGVFIILDRAGRIQPVFYEI